MLSSETPVDFVWRSRRWRVSEVIARWRETGPWWDSLSARAARGDDIGGDDSGRDDVGHGAGDGDEPLVLAAGPDLLAERDVWRVVAVAGSSSGVYELDHACGGHDWRLHAVVD